MTDAPMTNEQMVRVLNEWMRRFIQEPDRFGHEFQTVQRFLTEEAKGVEPSYGQLGAAYMHQISRELAA